MSIIERYRRNKAERTHLETVERASTLYQVQEYGGELWLTFDSCLICPCAMLKDLPVEAVTKMRTLYIERNSQL